LDLFRAQPPVGAGAKAAKLERAEADSLERRDRVPDLLAHAPDLPLAALVDRELDRVRRHAPDPCRRAAPVLELDAFAQSPQRPLAHRRTGHHRPVGLLDLEPRVGQPVRKLAVVGEQDQPRGVAVEPANGIQPDRCGHERDDRRAPLGVASGRNDAGRLVDRINDARLLVLHVSAVDSHLVARSDVTGGVRHRLLTDGHPSGPDDLLGRTPRRDPGQR